MGEAIIFGYRHAAIQMEQNIANTQPLHQHTEIAFEQVFKEHYKRLHGYAFTLLKDEDEAEEVVQNMFVKLWERKEQLHTLQSIPAYLYRSVYNDCMNVMKHEKVKARHQQFVKGTNTEAEGGHNAAALRELEQKLGSALAELPEQCRTIFQMSRFEELKYREIADKLGLSVKTIENQMGKALKLMRQKLADYLPLVAWVLFITLKNLLA